MRNLQENIVIECSVSLHVVQIYFYNVIVDILDYDIFKTLH